MKKYVKPVTNTITIKPVTIFSSSYVNITFKPDINNNWEEQNETLSRTNTNDTWEEW